ncbi:Plant invertase/pectin methylesterase inhibitor superfamily protein [Raphanus sativus]|uniref:Cell wall / vacuolar inhibitor of fructosidase 1-like n=1 Tax=Raphanus sativus TaxID=3726 RepID=A0A6J0P1N1_RAPSA|nr:cell wall / vacuolar inhibitor of fructosidase 1-like [Raphanus sativus]KAJ4893828.1 Plant invertase/pectin methylesterase inhibitor superfamily protein [Raphanus sativus]
MKKSSAVTSPPSLSFFLLMLLPLLAQSSDDLIDKICRVTPFIDLCEASLRPLAPSPSDPKSLASAMASVVLGNMTDTLGYIKSLIRHSHDPAAERALAQCAELYRPVVKFNIPQAIEAMRRGEFGFATYVLGDAEKQTDTCQKWINSAGADDESSVALTARNKQVKNLCDVAISVIKSLMKGR